MPSWFGHCAFPCLPCLPTSIQQVRSMTPSRLPATTPHTHPPTPTSCTHCAVYISTRRHATVCCGTLRTEQLRYAPDAPVNTGTNVAFAGAATYATRHPSSLPDFFSLPCSATVHLHVATPPISYRPATCPTANNIPVRGLARRLGTLVPSLGHHACTAVPLPCCVQGDACLLNQTDARRWFAAPTFSPPNVDLLNTGLRPGAWVGYAHYLLFNIIPQDVSARQARAATNMPRATTAFLRRCTTDALYAAFYGQT